MNRVENIRGPSYEEEGNNRGTLTLETETILPLMRSGDPGEELLPGIRNYITLSMVSPMLSWGDLASLSTVSPGWQEAVESRLVYNERVRSHSTESLAVVILCDYHGSVNYPSVHKLCLYSMKDESWYELPVPEEILYISNCTYVALDGKLYVIEGTSYDLYWTKAVMYVLDLVGERQWKQCASLQGFRMRISLVAVKHGKIHVLGLQHYTCGVYDPEVDAWSYLSPVRRQVPTPRYRIVTLGGEIFLQSIYLQYKGDYHPDSGLWRVIEDFKLNMPSGAPFSAQGKLHVLNNDGIFVLDIDEQSWTLLQSCSFPIPQGESGSFRTCRAVGHELVAFATVSNYSRARTTNIGNHVVLQSYGFGQENKEIVWERVAIPSLLPIFTHLQGSIQL